jgi:uncharacterized membrane protein
MHRFQIGFEHPLYLLLLLLLPLLWWWSYRRLVSLGAFRRAMALLLRTIVFSAVVCALAGIQAIRTSDKVAVIYVLDQSDSIPRAKRELMLEFVRESSKRHRRADREDLAGLIVFGREAAIEIQPFDDALPQLRSVESNFSGSDATNLEAALKLAQATFPEGCAKRIVVVTDGLETLGTATPTAKSIAQAGIGMDVVPVTFETASEVYVEKIDLPSNIRQGQPIEARVVIEKYRGNGDQSPIAGKLRVSRRLGSQQEVLVDEEVVLDRDVNVFPLRHTIDQPAGYIYEAEFIANDIQQDTLSQNNRVTAFAYVRGKGRVLIIENWRAAGEYDLLVETLRKAEIEVDLMPSNQLFTSLAELQGYDCVILAGVPRTSGEDASEISEFTSSHIDMLVRNTEQFGCGLLMIGGPEAFGAGGWAQTELEKAMPVDFQIKNSKVEAVGALAMILHASEIPEGNYWQKVIARSAIDVLGPLDYCGVINYDNVLNSTWLWDNGLSRVGANRQAMRARLSRMVPGDMPDFAPAMQMALTGLQQTKASIKHAIIISDGDPAEPSNALINQFAAAQIKVSTVAVGAHGPAGHKILQKIATVTGGNYYVVTNPKSLPKIFVREAMRVSKPLIYEPDGGVQPSVSYPHEVLQGISSDLPSIKGFVLTTVKESPLVQVAIRSPKPSEPENQTLLATWNFGLGRTAVFTSDAGKRWATTWQSWNDYERFWSQLVRWTMRPSEDDGKYSIATQLKDGKVQVIVNALDKDDRFLNFVDFSAAVVGPDMKPAPLTFRQQAPGRYVGEFDAKKSGSYMMSVSPGAGKAILTSGVNVPFSDEYLMRPANLDMLKQFSAQVPEGGTAGELATALQPESLEDISNIDRFREGLKKATRLTDIWPWMLLLGSVLFFSDVFIRRVAVDPSGLVTMIAGRFGKKVSERDLSRESNLERLRSRKASVDEALASQRASTRFEPTAPTSSTSEGTLTEILGEKKDSKPKSSTETAGPKLADDKEKESYTSRLLAAKKAAKKSQGEN